MAKHKHIDQYGITEYSTWYKIFLAVASLYLFIAVAAVALSAAEHQANGNITNYGDAFWVIQMSCSTIGFGDFYPVSTFGRVIVSLSFYVGVGLAGYIGSTIASALTSHTDQSVMNRELRQQNEEILKLLRKDRCEVYSHSADGSSRTDYDDRL